jgi:hypothetical protein
VRADEHGLAVELVHAALMQLVDASRSTCSAFFYSFTDSQEKNKARVILPHRTHAACLTTRTMLLLRPLSMNAVHWFQVRSQVPGQRTEVPEAYAAVVALNADRPPQLTLAPI